MADRKKVVVVGGGIGGAYVARHLEDSLDVTLIDSKDYFEVRWATLRAVVEPAVATKCIWSHTDYLKKAKVVVDDVVGLTPSEVQTKGSQAYPYDYLVIATGSKGAEQKTTAERQGHFVKLRERLDKASKVLVVGGGPVGVELAAEIATDFPTKHVTLVHSGSRLCEFMTEGAAAKALTWLKKNKVGVLLNDRVELDATVAGGPTELIPNEGTRVFTTAKGTEVHADMWYKATGDRIHTEWIRNTHIGSSLNDKGELRVEDTLVVSGTENVFAVGDVVGFQTPKQGYLALEEGKVVVANIKTLASGRGSGSSAAALKKYKPKADVAILTLGRNNGVLQTPIGSFTGLLPKVIKSKGLFISKLRGDLRMRC